MGLPGRMWVWEFITSEQNDVMEGGWDDVKDRKSVEYVRADLVFQWQPIETAPVDELHVRGLWVHSAQTGKRIRWEAIVGSMDDEIWEFRDYYGDTPWRADDYTHWMPLPAPPKQEEK